MPGDGAVLEQFTFGGVEPVESGADHGLQRLGDRQVAEIAQIGVNTVAIGQLPAGQHHPHHLYRVQWSACRPFDDGIADGGIDARGHSIDQIDHVGVGERSQMHRNEAVPSLTPAGPALQQIGASERDDKDRVVPRPLRKLLDKVEQRRVGRVEVLEDEHGGAPVCDSFEECPEGSEQLGLVTDRGVTDTKQAGQPGFEPLRFLGVRNPIPNRIPQQLTGSDLVVDLGDMGPRPDHLPERPQRHPVAV